MPDCYGGVARGNVTKTRRERNREAQQAFRKRRRAYDEAREKKLKTLDRIIDQMSFIFTNLVDEVVQLESVARDHPGLVRSIHHSGYQILKLAEDASQIDEDEMKISDSSDDHKGRESATGAVDVDLAIDPNLSATSSAEHDGYHLPLLDNNLSGSTDLPNNSFRTLIETDSNPHADHKLTQFDPQNSHPLHIGILDSFFHLLVTTTLANAHSYLNYDTFLEAASFQRAFGAGLKTQTRQHMLAKMEWLLGAGRGYISSAAGFRWGEANGPVDPLATPSVCLEQTVELDHGQYKSSENNNQPLLVECLTAFGVQNQLDKMGAKAVNHEFMEIVASRVLPHFYSDTQTVDSLHWPHWAALHYRGRDSKDKASESDSPTLRVSIAILASNLAEMAMCNDKGPLYPKQGIVEALRASAMSC